jgi:hypothetical protein
MSPELALFGAAERLDIHRDSAPMPEDVPACGCCGEPEPTYDSLCGGCHLGEKPCCAHLKAAIDAQIAGNTAPPRPEGTTAARGQARCKECRLLYMEFGQALRVCRPCLELAGAQI